MLTNKQVKNDNQEQEKKEILPPAPCKNCTLEKRMFCSGCEKYFKWRDNL